MFRNQELPCTFPSETAVVIRGTGRSDYIDDAPALGDVLEMVIRFGEDATVAAFEAIGQVDLPIEDLEL